VDAALRVKTSSEAFTKSGKTEMPAIRMATTKGEASIQESAGGPLAAAVAMTHQHW
jgi:hypothetical protein